MTSMWYAMREALAIVAEQGLESMWARHEAAHKQVGSVPWGSGAGGAGGGRHAAPGCQGDRPPAATLACGRALLAATPA